MWENVLLWIIIGGCAFFIGRKFYRQWRNAFKANGQISCNCGCSGCGSDSCDDKR